MATYSLPAAYKTSNGKDVTVGDFSMTATYEVATDTILTSTGATQTTAPVAGDVLEMIRVPANVTVLDGFLAYDAVTTTSASVGDQSSGNDNRYISALNISSAGKTYFTSAEAFPKTYTTADTIDITFTTGNPSAGTITLVLFCTSDEVDIS